MERDVIIRRAIQHRAGRLRRLLQQRVDITAHGSKLLESPRHRHNVLADAAEVRHLPLPAPGLILARPHLAHGSSSRRAAVAHLLLAVRVPLHHAAHVRAALQHLLQAHAADGSGYKEEPPVVPAVHRHYLHQRAHRGPLPAHRGHDHALGVPVGRVECPIHLEVSLNIRKGGVGGEVRIAPWARLLHDVPEHRDCGRVLDRHHLPEPGEHCTAVTENGHAAICPRIVARVVSRPRKGGLKTHQGVQVPGHGRGVHVVPWPPLSSPSTRVRP
mmetsp:Transcript_12336/g.39088  ORF Transcript_12336/g.39088 Transcript_12336/m.39088 type:complete len:272 (+) Transcript_12336:695-1510(+)